ncbi:MAG: cyclase [Betaproteobacteria bacterium]|nr:cyclase [Betaproteobacteria bacterium]
MPGARSFLLPLLALVIPAQAAEVVVHATRNGEALEVEARAEFAGGIARTWQVLTDYDRIADYVPGVASSRVISRDRNGAVVEQKGEAKVLFFSYPINVRLVIAEHPYERLESRAVAGNFREMRGTYELEAGEGHVLLRYTGRMIPDFYVPPLIGTWVLSHHVERTFRALVEEIERQHREPGKP